ncbi:MAG: hypothetical protein LBI05_09710 [Planctomycetaceae bacterium]|jgi:hypothetical protein|nr:hypothetical protein [Planctomycetaceae bacterium]
MEDKPELFCTLSKVFNRVQYKSYLAKYRLLVGENRDRFRQVMKSQLGSIVDSGEMMDYTWYDAVRFQKALNPNSFGIGIKFQFASAWHWLMKVCGKDT